MAIALIIRAIEHDLEIKRQEAGVVRKAKVSIYESMAETLQMVESMR